MSPGIAKSLAEALSVPLELVAFPGPGGDNGDDDDAENHEEEVAEALSVSLCWFPSLNHVHSNAEFGDKFGLSTSRILYALL